ncbi:hypothetical protein K435DRAFT_866395 [Dendrothele bispora CBS 962.96]|uniref:Uncharacterized protein n=1 Tax=Dendrothele bispora (strain CBS 962.96) TaxID=1314807 RepID=A0A4V4HDR9_DENBC|nr:hypothetical protein K435DRAFT_866395 [Dendrothele bispora CBS 962.96]
MGDKTDTTKRGAPSQFDAVREEWLMQHFDEYMKVTVRKEKTIWLNQAVDKWFQAFPYHNQDEPEEFQVITYLESKSHSVPTTSTSAQHPTSVAQTMSNGSPTKDAPTDPSTKDTSSGSATKDASNDSTTCPPAPNSTETSNSSTTPASAPDPTDKSNDSTNSVPPTLSQPQGSDRMASPTQDASISSATATDSANASKKAAREMRASLEGFILRELD